MRLATTSRRDLSEAAMGRIPCDLALRNVQLLNCFTGEIYPATVGIKGNAFACVSADPDGQGDAFPIETTESYDGGGQFLIPGFIDSHLHIESSMITPPTMAETTAPLGTTTLVTDPHEVANVGGIEAVSYMIESSHGLPQRHFIMAPSSVPAVPELEDAGASFDGPEMERLLSMERVLGLAELMDCAGVIDGSPRMERILAVGRKRGVFFQGHAPFMAGRRLNAYLSQGVQSDHETRTAEEAREKMRLGMTVDAREGSISTDVTTIVRAVKDFGFLGNLTLCTDDREPHDLMALGHMNYVVARAVDAGLSPVQAVVCATLNAARELGIVNLGAVAPGWIADCQLVPDLTAPQASAVFFEGRLIARDGALVAPLERKTFAAETRNTMRLDMPQKEDLRLAAPAGCGSSVRARVLRYQSADTSVTDLVEETLPVTDGFIDLTDRPDLKFAAVFDRHGSGRHAVAVVKDFGIREGAVAATVSHDCHNLALVFDTPENALLAIGELIACGGGHCAVMDGRVLATLPLPVYGLLSPLPCCELVPLVERQKDALRSLGLDTKNPIMRIVSLALPVIPHGKLTDRGLVDVDEQKIVPIFP